MHLCVNSLTALALLRSLRAEHPDLSLAACGVPEPDPWPRRRWSARLIPYHLLGRSKPPSSQDPIHVVAPDAGSRPKARVTSVTTYGKSIPPGSFARVSEEFTVPCPELLFLELAGVMNRAALELVGYELCGTYSRSPINPRTGPVSHGVEPLSSVDKIEAYLHRCHHFKAMDIALEALRNVRDNAWSSMEAIVSLFLVRPVEDCGYGVKNLELNTRERTVAELQSLVVREFRVPDISLGDLPVGFNYDGHGHLDLKSIDVEKLEKDELRAALAEVREKYVDDLKRNRELLASGRIVMPIVAEDLVDRGGLDTVLLEAVIAVERLVGTSGKVGESVRRALEPPYAAKRQQLLWSLYPWMGGTSLGNY